MNCELVEAMTDVTKPDSDFENTNLLKQFNDMSTLGENWHFPVIYKLVNKITGRFYVGMSSKFYDRLLEHIRNFYAQNAANLSVLQQEYGKKYPGFVSNWNMNYKMPTSKMDIEKGKYLPTDFYVRILKVHGLTFANIHSIETEWIIKLYSELSLNAEHHKPRGESIKDAGKRLNREVFERFNEQNKTQIDDTSIRYIIDLKRRNRNRDDKDFDKMNAILIHKHGKGINDLVMGIDFTLLIQGSDKQLLTGRLCYNTIKPNSLPNITSKSRYTGKSR